MNIVKFCCIFLVFKINLVSAVEPRVVCYYTNWSVYRPGTAKFNPQNINPYLCTHLIYAFGGFTKDNTLKPFDKYQDIEQGGYAKFTGLKTYNKELKTMLAIGGWNEGSSRFSPLVNSAERRHQFVKNTIKYLRQNHFDGLDLDWEYPAFRDGGKARDRDNYAKLVQELREEFDRESSKTGRPRLLLTMAVPAGFEYIDKGYDIPKLNKHLDWFNLLSYDYHSAFEPSVNHHSPLYSEEEGVDSEYNYDADLNINATIHYYLNAGAEREKLVLGIPTYGRSYTLYNPDATDIGAPADGPGEQGDATREKGYLAYYEICQSLKDPEEGWTVVQPNPNALGPYAYRDNQWVGYDDEDIVRKKSKFVVDENLGGIMFWSIDNDDFRGLCGGKPYPLIEAAKESLLYHIENSQNVIQSSRQSNSNVRIRTQNRNRGESAVTQATTSAPRRKQNQRTKTTPATTTTTARISYKLKTTTPPPPTTPDPGSDFKCEEEGFFEHPRDCKKYFWCLEAAGLGIVAHQFTCPSGLYFNKAADSCDYARNVPCQKKDKTTTTTTSTTSKPATDAPSTTAASNYKNPFFSRTTTKTTTTTPAYDDEYEYDLEDEDVPETSLDQEDPKVIKELIDLIKKVGGLDELEKQFNFHNSDSPNTKTNNDVSTTPPAISKSLYERVLSRATAFKNKNTFNGGSQIILPTQNKDSAKTNTKTKYSSINSRTKSQSSGLENLSEFDGFLREKPQYITITRTNTRAPSSGQAESDYNEAQESSDGTESSIEEEDVPKRTKTQNRYNNFQYTSIRREKPSAVVQQDDIDDETTTDAPVRSKSSPQYISFSRQRPTKTEEPATTTTTTEASVPQRSTTRYSSLIRSRYSTKSPIQSEEDEIEQPDTTEPSQSVSTIDSNLLQNQILQSSTPVYKTIDRKTSKTTTIQPITDQTDFSPITITPSLDSQLSASDDLLSDIDLLTENIIFDSTEQVTVTVDPFIENEVITEKILPIYTRLFTQSASEKDVITNLNNINNLISLDEKVTQNETIETENLEKANQTQTILNNTRKESTVYAPRPFSPPRRLQTSTTNSGNDVSTTRKRISNQFSDSGKVSLSDSQTRIPVRSYSTLSPRRSQQFTSSNENENTTPRPFGADKGRGRVRFYAKPTKSGYYNKTFDSLSQPTINEQLINENRLRAINFDRNTAINSQIDRDNERKTDTRITKLNIGSSSKEIEGRPDRVQFELTSGKKIAFGFTSKRPLQQLPTKPNSDSPIVRVLTGPLSKSPIVSANKDKGDSSELKLLKTKTTTINLGESKINVTSYSSKQNLLKKYKLVDPVTESPDSEESTLSSLDVDYDTTFSPNDEIVQSEGNSGFIPRTSITTKRRFFTARPSPSTTDSSSSQSLENVQPESEIGVIQRANSTYRKRPFLSGTRAQPSIESLVKETSEKSVETERQNLYTRKSNLFTRTRPTTAAEEQDDDESEDDIIIVETTEKSTSPTRTRLRPSKSGFRTRQSLAPIVDSTESGKSSTTSRYSTSFVPTLEIDNDDEELVNIILTEDDETSTNANDPEQTTPEDSNEETSQATSTTTTQKPGRRRIVQVVRKPAQQATVETESNDRRTQANRFTFESRNAFSNRTRTNVSIGTRGRRPIQRPVDESGENKDSSTSETTERNSYSLPVEDKEEAVKSPPTRKRVRVYRPRTRLPEETQSEKQNEEETESVTPSNRIRKTKIIRRTKAPVVEDSENEEVKTDSKEEITKKEQNAKKQLRTRIFRKKVVKTEDSQNAAEETDVSDSPVSSTEKPSELVKRKKVFRVIKKNSTKTEVDETEPEVEVELSTSARPTRPSRVTFVRRINVNNNENDNNITNKPPSGRRTLIRRPISSRTTSTTTTTTTTTELPESSEEDDDEEEEDETDLEDNEDSQENTKKDIQTEILVHKQKVSITNTQIQATTEEDEDDDISEEEDDEELEDKTREKPVSNPVLRYPTRPAFGPRPSSVTIKRRPFVGSTRQTTIHPASTRFAATQGFGFTKTRRVTTKKFNPKISGNFKFTKQPTTAAPQNTFTPLQDTEDFITTTIDYNDEYDHTELINNENILQDVEGSGSGGKSKRPGSKKSTTTLKPTTLHHVFAIDSDGIDDESKLNKLDGSNVTESAADEIIKKLEKLVEINRIVEIHTKEEKRKLSKNRRVKKIDTGDLQLLQPPTYDKYGEISRLVLVKLAKVPETTEKTTTIKNQKTSLFSEAIFNVETSTIPLEGLFDLDKKSRDDEIETSTFIPEFTTNVDDMPEDTTESIPRAKTTLKLEKVSANDKNVSLLRPESSESDPLVISIANLDQVILSKVQNSETTSPRPSPVFRPAAAVADQQKDGDTAGSSKVVVVDSTTKRTTTQIYHRRNTNFNRKYLTTTRSYNRNVETTTPITIRSTSNPLHRRRKPAKTITTTVLPDTITSSVNSNEQPKFQRKTQQQQKTNVFRKPAGGQRGEIKSRDKNEITTEEYKSTTSNPLYRRRVSATAKFKRPVTSTTPKEDLKETTQKLVIENETPKDQGVDSTIQKFTKNRYNQIGESIEDVAGLLQQFAEAPVRPERLPFSKSLKPSNNLQQQQFTEVSSTTKLPFSHKSYHDPFTSTTQRINHHKQFIEEVHYTNLPSSSSTRPTKPRIHNNPIIDEFFEQKTEKQYYFPTTVTQRKDSVARYQRPSAFDKLISPNNYFTQLSSTSQKPLKHYKEIANYDYYDDEEDRILGKLNSQVKVIIHSNGNIECQESGVFPHPFSCKKFIQCAKMKGVLVGYVFHCPKNLSFDPVGGICNWNFACKDN